MDGTGAGTSADTDQDDVVLVDEDDRELGRAPKLEVHRDGRLHRAVSVFVFDRDGRVLLQRRAAGKYHSAGLWANTCCGHPRPGEAPLAAARRRLRAEMGLDLPLRPVGVFRYRAELDRGLIEHELDHVFTARLEGEPRPDPGEVMEWRLAPIEQLERDLSAAPERYVAWLPPALACAR